MKYCMNCGKLLPPAANFCTNCGQSLADAAAQIAAARALDPSVNPTAPNENTATENTARGMAATDTAATATDGTGQDAQPTAPTVGTKYGKTADDMGTSFGPVTRPHPTTEAETVFGSTEEYVDTRDHKPRLGIAILSFFLWWLGLILWSVNKEQRPGLANSALKGALTFICMILPPLGLVLFIAWNKSRRDFARPVGIAAILGLILLIAAYILYIALLIYTI